jgi:hypothetical protein
VVSEQQDLDRVFARFFLGFAATPDDTVLLLGSGREEWWTVLGVQPDADQAAIRNAYKPIVLRIGLWRGRIIRMWAAIRPSSSACRPPIRKLWRRLRRAGDVTARLNGERRPNARVRSKD